MRVNYDNIPREMREYRQWICWRMEEREGTKPTKVPYDPRNAHMASVTDPHSWVSFDEAVNYAKAGLGYDGVGFVLTKRDPYTIIDLDDTNGDPQRLQNQLAIYAAFDSYSEKSPSGTGLHIIVQGDIPSGKRRGAVEVYSSERYMTMTGDVFNDKPIEKRQGLLDTLWAEMARGGGIDTSIDDQPQSISDEEVIRRALDAVNGDKFNMLLNGNWKDLYSSQSEADFAFINIITFYSLNREQIIRIFRNSSLGQRKKAKRNDYVDYMILRAFDQQLPTINMEDIKEKAEEYLQAQSISGGGSGLSVGGGQISPAVSKIRNFWQNTELLPPPGLLGDIAKFIYQASPRPVKEIAIAGAIALLAGITGRAYNVSGTGLNMYVLLVAPTGTGKEAMASGINKLMSTVCLSVPSADSFRGPAEIASGQALYKHLANNNPCFLSLIGEFGLKMQQLANPRATTSEIMLRRAFLSLFHKSGAKDMLDSSIFADKNNNSASVKSPAVSVLGETTPETLYSALDESLITDGLLPRFTVIEYTGIRPELNEVHQDVQPIQKLVDELSALCTYSLTMQHGEKVIDVEYTPEARDFLNKVNRLADDAINSTQTEVLRHLWNRAHIKTLKLAALCAVGRHLTSPKITLEDAQWAYNIISSDVVGMVARFSRGEIGKNTEENKQGKTILKMCGEYLVKPFQQVANYGNFQNLHTNKIIPLSYLQRRLLTLPLFKNDKRGATLAVRMTLQGLVDTGDLQEVSRNSLNTMYKYSGRAFVCPHPMEIEE